MLIVINSNPGELTQEDLKIIAEQTEGEGKPITYVRLTGSGAADLNAIQCEVVTSVVLETIANLAESPVARDFRMGPSGQTYLTPRN